MNESHMLLMLPEVNANEFHSNDSKFSAICVAIQIICDDDDDDDDENM